MNILNNNKPVNLIFTLKSLGISLLILFITSSSFADVRTQFIPTVSISEEYTDNYHQTENDTDDEFSTIYSAGFSFGVISQNASLFLNYNPAYTDYDKYNENDSWNHDVSLEGQMQMSQHTSITLSHSFEHALDRTVTTNSWQEHDTNTTTAGVHHQFGARDYISVDYSYTFDDYDEPSADEHKTHNPSISFAYWLTPQYGFDLNAAWEKTEYDISTDEPETWSGDIRFLKNINRHLDIYLSYAHTYTDQESGDHTTFNPSIGFDWRPTDDSGITMGAGMIFQEWGAAGSEDSDGFFIDFDMYKNFEISRRCTVGLTGSSGYDPTDDEAASLGFHIYYQAGVLLSYELTRRLTGELNGTYTIDQYDDPVVDRNDTTLGLGADLIWSPLRWLSLTLSYTFTDYDTDTATREDYQENTGMITITMTPSQEVRFGASNPRSDLENRLFN